MDAIDKQQLPALIKEWVTLNDDIRTLGIEIKEKRKRLKATRDMITKFMKGNRVGQLNISAGQVRHRTKQTKQALTKKYIITTLTEFFGGDAAMAAKCAAFLEEKRPIKTAETLTLDPGHPPPSPSR
jgi:hypothetical protein